MIKGFRKRLKNKRPLKTYRRGKPPDLRQCTRILAENINLMHERTASQFQDCHAAFHPTENGKPTAPRGKDWSVRAPYTIHTEELAGSESWGWLKPGDIMEELEGLKNVRGNILNIIYRTNIVCNCSKLAQRDYKMRDAQHIGSGG